MQYRKCSLSGLDTTARGRILCACWLCAAAGSSILQMLLLAQAWHQEQQALRTACIASAWLIGKMTGGWSGNARASIAQSRTAPLSLVWGIAFLGCAAGWWAWPGAPGPSRDPITGTLSLLGIAFLLGLFGSLWLGQQHRFAAVGERAVLIHNAAGLVFGLVIVWCLPGWSLLIALASLLPLLLLDVLAPPLNPPAPWGSTTGALLDGRAGPAGWLPLRLQHRPHVAGWWKPLLVRRGYTTLLTIGTGTMLGAVWNAIPTPFAGELAITGETSKLLWLLGGQLTALTLGVWLLRKGRSLVGAPGRLIPLLLRPLAWQLAWLAFVFMAVSLVLLGLPRLQDPWWLALSLGIYTLAASTWGILLPRLQPGRVTEVVAQRHLAFGQGRVVNSGRLAYEQALEERVGLTLGRGEGLLTVVCTLLVGLLIDRLTVDSALVFAGVVFAWFLAAVLIIRLARVRGQLAFP